MTPRSASGFLDLANVAKCMVGTPSTEAKPAPITDPEKLQEALTASYVNLQKAIKGLSDNDLRTPVKLFGRDMTKLEAMVRVKRFGYRAPNWTSRC